MTKIFLFFIFLFNFANGEIFPEKTFNLENKSQPFEYSLKEGVFQELNLYFRGNSPAMVTLGTKGWKKLLVNFENGKIRFQTKRLNPITLVELNKGFSESTELNFRIKYKNLKIFAKVWPQGESEPVEWDLGYIFPKDPKIKKISTKIQGPFITLSTTTGPPLGNKRGRYFPKKILVTSRIPSYSELKEVLPEPVLKDETLLKMYWKAMEIAASHIKNPEKNSGLVSTFLDEAFRPNIFQWDTIFMMFFANYFYPHISLISSLDNFYANQHDDGAIWREIKESNGEDFYGVKKNFINPPLFAWAEWNYYRISMDKGRLQMVLPAIENYMDYLEIQMKAQFSPHRLYWNNPFGSGMDTIPVETSSSHGWVDMSSQMVLAYRSLSKICNELGLLEKSLHYSKLAQSIKDRVNKWMWNEETGLYSDLNESGNKQNVAQIGIFWPMIAEIPSKNQIERMIQKLKDPEFFNTDLPFPSIAKNHPKFDPAGGYWMGAVWAPCNFMTLKGLEVNDFTEDARIFSQRYLDGLVDVFKETGTLWETYAPTKDSQGKFRQDAGARKDFVGWTGLGPITLLIENIIGITLDPINKKIDWDLNRMDLHGIKKLSVGKNTLSLISNPRNSRKEYSLEIDATRSSEKVILVVKNLGKKREFSIEPGKINFLKSNN